MSTSRSGCNGASQYQGIEFDRDKWHGLFLEMAQKYSIQQEWRHFEPFLKLLLSLPRKEYFLEVGSFRGGASRIFQEVFNKVITMDPSEYEGWTPDIKRLSHDPEAVAELRSMLGGEMLDAVFIDGDHSYANARRDLAIYAPMVRDGGIVAFHDSDNMGINPWTLKKEGGKRLFEEIKGRTTVVNGRDISFYGDPLIDVEFEWYDLGGLAAFRWKKQYAKIFEDSIYIPYLDMAVQKGWTDEEGFKEIKELAGNITSEIEAVMNKYEPRLHSVTWRFPEQRRERPAPAVAPAAASCGQDAEVKPAGKAAEAAEQAPSAGVGLFPEEDAYWSAAADFLAANMAADESVIAPSEFEEKFPGRVLFPYPAGPLEKDAVRWVLVHKGMVRDMDKRFLRSLSRLAPVFANEVFVLLSIHSRVPRVDEKSPHVVSFRELAGGAKTEDPLKSALKNLFGKGRGR